METNKLRSTIVVMSLLICACVVGTPFLCYHLLEVKAQRDRDNAQMSRLYGAFERDGAFDDPKVGP